MLSPMTEKNAGTGMDTTLEDDAIHTAVVAEADSGKEIGLDLYLEADDSEYTEAEARRV